MWNPISFSLKRSQKGVPGMRQWPNVQTERAHHENQNYQHRVMQLHKNFQSKFTKKVPINGPDYLSKSTQTVALCQLNICHSFSIGKSFTMGRGKHTGYVCIYCKQQFKTPKDVVNHVYLAKMLEGGKGRHGPMMEKEQLYCAGPRDRDGGSGSGGSQKA